MNRRDVFKWLGLSGIVGFIPFGQAVAKPMSKLGDFFDCPKWYSDKYTKQAITDVIWPAFRYPPFADYIIGSRITDEGEYTYTQDQDTGEVKHHFRPNGSNEVGMGPKYSDKKFATAKDYHEYFAELFMEHSGKIPDEPIEQLVDDSWFRGT